MKIFGDIFPNGKVVTIAEIGINHNGSCDKAEEMIIAAKKCGADAVKFQTFNPESLYTVYTKSAQEGRINSFKDSSIIDFFSSFVLSEKSYTKLKRLADKNKIIFFSAPFDNESVDLLNRIGVSLFKLASSELTNTDLIRYVLKYKKPIILSTGISKKNEITEAVNIIKKTKSDLALLHCVSLYPVPPECLNLNRITALAKDYRVPVGFSDHSIDIDASITAAALGGKIIEKHFVLENDNSAPDFNVSINPAKFAEMVDKIRSVVKMTGSASYEITKDEAVIRKMSIRSAVAARDINCGEKIKSGDFIFKRPGLGLNINRRKSIIGRKTKLFIAKDAFILEEYLS